jgi:site-specific DNA-cytosine methylase
MPAWPRKRTEKRTEKGLRAIGITCGIGSMLVGARQAGFDVVGNVEWRRYYHVKDSEGRNTFEENFPGAIFKKSIDELTEEGLGSMTGCDLAMGHPECGAYSQMQGCNNFRDQATRRVKPTDPGDIPLFVDLVARLRPRFFAMDDLPKSLHAFPMEEYARRLPDYDLFPEWVSNYHYGNIQRSRRRMFMIGSLKSEQWVFTPGEVENESTLSKVLSGLPVDPSGSRILNHDVHTETEPAGRLLHMDYLWHRPTWADGRRWFEGVEEGTTFLYHSPHADGELKMKPGWYKQRWGGHCAVLDGGSGHIHPLRNLPFTIRERARIQGFPDDFVFYGTGFNDEGEWNHEKNLHMVKQTGKAMPVQFCWYVAGQIAAYILGTRFESSGVRLLKPNEYVDGAKLWYCREIGYSNRDLACSKCWLAGGCSVRVKTLPAAAAGCPALAEGRVPGGSGELTLETRGSPRTPRPKGVSTLVARIETRVVRFGDRSREPEGVTIPRVNLIPGKTPNDYHCNCRFCSRVIGELVQVDGSYYSRLERRRYYDPSENGKSGHIAKTPLHVARWAIQEYTKPGDWVLDPTIGAGTTAVEALIQGRDAAGMELQYERILSANLSRHAVGPRECIIGFGDAEDLAAFLSSARVPRPTLVVNNPPYSGDESQVGRRGSELGGPDRRFVYPRNSKNLAFLKEGDEYWGAIERIYRAAAGYLLPGGRFIVGVKDMMRSKRPFLLHESLCKLLEGIGLLFVGTTFLRHYPGTLNLYTYRKLFGVEPPKYQTICVFKKKGATR